MASAALGLTQVLVPDRVAGALGVAAGPVRRSVLRAVGLRELGAAAGLLGERRPGPGWVWGRAAGDLMDMALLARVLKSEGRDNRRVAVALAGVAAVTALDVAVGTLSTRRDDTDDTPAMRAASSVTIRRGAEDVYRCVRDLTNLPRFVTHVRKVSTDADGTSHWVADGPVGTVDWDTAIVDDVPGSMLSWRSLPGSTIANEGSVRFIDAPRAQGTEVHVELTYRSPLGSAGVAVGRLFGKEPNQQLADDLRRLKQMLETGEVMA